MIEETGIVTGIDGMSAMLIYRKKAPVRDVPPASVLRESSLWRLIAFNKAGAEVGQKVKVLVHSYTYLKGTAIIYGMPALALVLGAVFGKEVMAGFFGTDADVLSAIFGFSFLVLSFVVVKIWSNHRTETAGSSPVIEEILS